VTAAACATLAIDRRLWPAVVIYVATVPFLMHWPDRVHAIFNISQCITFCCAGLAWVLLPPPTGPIAERTGLR
jgi:hypothetical protein